MERQSYVQALSQFVLSLGEQDKNLNPLEILQWSIPQLTRIVGANSELGGLARPDRGRSILLL